MSEHALWIAAVEGRTSKAIPHHELAIGYLLSAICYWLLAIGYSMSRQGREVKEARAWIRLSKARKTDIIAFSLKDPAGDSRYPGMKQISHPAFGFFRTGLDDGRELSVALPLCGASLRLTVAFGLANTRLPTLTSAAEGAGWAFLFSECDAY